MESWAVAEGPRAQIAEGVVQAERGDLVDGEEAMERLRRAAWARRRGLSRRFELTERRGAARKVTRGWVMAASRTCRDHEISADEDWILHERVSLTRDWMQPGAPGQLPFECGEATEAEAMFTMSDLVTLLRALPSPGEDYLAAVEEASRARQPVARIQDED